MSNEADIVERPAGGWLIVKRDLYFRPDCKGYTGIRDNAGRYSLDFAKEYECESTSIIHESEAPEFRDAAYSDLVIKHLIRQRDEVRAERASAAREMQERCARVADALAKDAADYYEVSNDPTSFYANQVADDIAAQIRALPESAEATDPVIATSGKDAT